MFIIVTIVALAVLFVLYRVISRARTRRRLLAIPLTDDQIRIIVDEVPMIKRLPEALRAPLEGKINLFLHQVTFHGCAGQEITEEMRLSIAAQACVLIVNIDDWYKTLRTILVYPSGFKSKRVTSHGDIRTEHGITLGESWLHGPVVLSWAATRHGAKRPNDGLNVVLHEFAHQLDALSGETNALPPLRKGQSFAKWRDTFISTYKRHRRKVSLKRKTFLRPYGATNLQELFAVSIEAFFEKPHELAKAEPKIYEQLSTLLRLDPRTWPTDT